MEILIIAAIGLFILSRSGFNLGSVLPTGQAAPTGSVPPAVAVQSTGNTSAQNAFTAVQTANIALNAVPVVGPALSAVANALTSAFAAASKRRAQQATSENQAVANAFPGWDQSMLSIQTAYNNGTISLQQALGLVDLAWSNYWQEVTPQIQPGRNGCQGGAIPKAQADSQFPGMRQCSGSWGAACCVGYADLANGANSIKAALTNTENTGTPSVASIPAVYASKYGGANRAAYTLTFTRPSTAFGL